MLFAKFDTAEKANSFIETVDAQELQYHDGDFIVFYKPIETVDEAKLNRIKEQRSKAEKQLALQEMDIVLIETMLKVHKENRDEEQVSITEKKLEDTKNSINAWKGQLEAVEIWEQA